MKNTLLATYSAPSALFLTAAFLLILNPLTGNAQSASSLESLDGTSWQGTITELPGVTTQYKYVFSEKGKVKESFRRQASGIDRHYEWNPITRDQDLKLKPFEKHYDGDMDCTYEQDGSSVQFKCGVRVWNATIQGNRMEGNITFSKGTPQQTTVKWAIERIGSHSENQNSVANGPSRDRANPTRLTSNEISGLVNKETKGNIYYYSFMANPGEISITLTVEPGTGDDSEFGVVTTEVGFALFLYDRDAAEVGDSVETRSGSSNFRAVIARVEITRRHRVVLAIDVTKAESVGAKYKVRIEGAVEVNQNSSR